MGKKTIVCPSRRACAAFWKSWEENGETRKHGDYESTWMAVRAYMVVADEEQRIERNKSQLKEE
ncbi:MAG: hypothetical protein GY941_12110 [Planctomycetes bacterium]|nr:hypothetical protein [Planctomycetota bacterium]